MKVHRSKERIKQTGEVFTPLELVDEMLSKLPEEVWAPGKTFLEPSCGDGNFLVRIVAWKIWKGSTIRQALKTTYGVDIMDDNITDARFRMWKHARGADRWRLGSDQLFPINHALQCEHRGIIKDDFKKRWHDPLKSIIERNIIRVEDALTFDYSLFDPDRPC